MKGKKKQPARSSGSRSNRKTTTRKSSSSAKAGKSAAAPDSKKLNSSVRDEIVAIILVAVGIFFIIAFQTEAAGSIGLSLSHFFKGLFGFAAHLLPYYFILYGVLLFMRKTIHVGVKSAVLLLIIFLMISLINSARFIDEAILNQRFWNVSVYYNNGMALDDGGAFGMMVGKMIVSLVGVPGLYIFSIVVIFICLLLIMNTPVSRFFEKAKERREKRREMQAEREKEKLERKAEQLERRQQQKRAERERMAGYGPETVEAAERSL
ncbi:MAG: DNA translocase FtsK 4TM domain-containing protein, partial [Anaerovoracaceae bacterium]|nr:DNA translocase FtsK 4TM domain-containing protein [Anaerovoracaceae bacterium]